MTSSLFSSCFLLFVLLGFNQMSLNIVIAWIMIPLDYQILLYLPWLLYIVQLISEFLFTLSPGQFEGSIHRWFRTIAAAVIFTPLQFLAA